jgi:hypothetical protein
MSAKLIITGSTQSFIVARFPNVRSMSLSFVDVRWSLQRPESGCGGTVADGPRLCRRTMSWRVGLAPNGSALGEVAGNTCPSHRYVYRPAVYTWFHDVLSRIGAHSIQKLDELLPHRWAASRP